MKGNARAHTTNEQYRKGYDQICWGSETSGADRGQLPRAPDVLDAEPVLPLHGDLLGPDGQETEAGRRGNREEPSQFDYRRER